MNTYEFITAEKTNFPITFMCERLEVSTSSYYDWIDTADKRAAIQAKEDALVVKMRAIHKKSAETYGSPRMTPALRAMGYCINHKRVEKLMQKHDIVGYSPRKKIRTTIPAKDIKTLPDLVNRDFDKQSQDHSWCGDISYIHTGEGWLYLATVIDLGSKRVIGFSMADHMRTELIETALRGALGTRGIASMDGTIFHSDRGSQYMSEDFANLCEQFGITRSVGRSGICWDNAAAESFFATLKKELVYRTKFATREQARLAIFNYIEGWYNTVRLHSTIGYMSPVNWEQAQTESTTVTDNAA